MKCNKKLSSEKVCWTILHENNDLLIIDEEEEKSLTFHPHQEKERRGTLSSQINEEDDNFVCLIQETFRALKVKLTNSQFNLIQVGEILEKILACLMMMRMKIVRVCLSSMNFANKLAKEEKEEDAEWEHDEDDNNNN